MGGSVVQHRTSPEIAVVIPSYRVRDKILGVLAQIGPECSSIYVVDDACPEGTGKVVEQNCTDPRVHVLHHGENQGVGGATMTGYRRAIEEGAEIVVKLDGDGQMDPGEIPRLTRPIVNGAADYTKGNRFHELRPLREMPQLRLFGNAMLSFFAKASSGYWNLFDPTNGFTAIHARVLERLSFEKLSSGYFFESDILFRLNLLRAVVRDVPMEVRYGSEQSSLVIRRVIGTFLFRHLTNTLKRVFYNYFLRNFTVASVELVAGLALLAVGGYIGATYWIESITTATPATSGTVMFAALPVVIGMQLMIAFLMQDVMDVPQEPLHPNLPPTTRKDWP